jgi:SAM-dependent methyltransferase
MHVLDLGCGVGDLSLLAARLVGAAGAVLGIDQNASSVELARARAAALGARNVNFEAAELDGFDSVQTFDAVIGRLILLYLSNPAASLRRLRRFLKRGGIIAFQEMDMEPASEVPASELFNRVRGWILGAFRAAGAELNMGSRMLPVFLGAGLPRPTMIASGRVESGPDSQAYDYVVRVLRSLLPELQRAGLATADEVAIETLVDRLRQDAVLSA